MAIKFNGTNITDLEWDGSDKQLATLDGTYKWARPYTLTIGGSNHSYINITCYRYSTKEPTAGTGSSAGSLSSGSTIYYNDTIYSTGTTRTNTRYVSKSASPVSFSGNYINNTTGNETIYYYSYSCTCGSTNNSSSCTTCASSNCGNSLSGSLCSTAAYRKCNCSNTSITAA